jgi:hypothetical protein
MEPIESLFKLLDRIPFRVILLATVLLTGGLLVAPDYWLVVLRLENFESEYGWLVGIGFAVSLALLVANALMWGWEWLQEAWKDRARERAMRSSIGTLDEHEKQVLREFYIQNKNTILLPIENPTVAGLLRKEIICIVGEGGQNISGVGTPFPVGLSPLALTLINPQSVGISLDKLAGTQSGAITWPRPSFLKYMW